jgi:FHA domain/Zinc-ribbon containing domain
LGGGIRNPGSWGEDLISTRTESFKSGRVVGAGSLICRGCGYRVMLEALDEVPDCPTCGGTAFRRASLFEPSPTEAEQPTVDQPVLAPGRHEPEWLAAARSRGAAGLPCVAFQDEDEDRAELVPLAEGWLRVGRSVTADIRLDDPTVSRRHALIVRTEEGRIRVLDDRSLNGVFVNGRRVEWSPLHDGDELAIGRYRLYLIDEAGRRSRFH